MTSTTSGSKPADATARFFEGLGQRHAEPLLRNVTGRVRFDVVEGDRTERWLVAVGADGMTVTRGKGPVDCTIRGERSVFEEIVRGRMNMTAAVLRGALTCHGDLELLLAIQRIFPDPPPGWDPTASSRRAT